MQRYQSKINGCGVVNAEHMLAGVRERLMLTGAGSIIFFLELTCYITGPIKGKLSMCSQVGDAHRTCIHS